MTFDPQTQAEKQGWAVLEKRRVNGDGFQAPGYVTLCDRPEFSFHRWRVHFFNEQDGGFHGGEYFDDRAKADAAFEERCKSYGARHEK